jgi:CheY-like chemotaxis protein
LVVDDEPFNVLAIEGLLMQKSINFKVEKSFNGEDALEKVKASSKTHSYHLILLDNWMPVMTGIECAKAIRDLQRQGLAC